MGLPLPHQHLPLVSTETLSTDARGSVKVKPAQTDLLGAIHAASEHQIQELATPTLSKVDTLRRLLDRYEAAIQAGAYYNVMSKLLGVLGQTVEKPEESPEDIEDEIFAELDGLTPEWAKTPPPAATIPPAPPTPAPVSMVTEVAKEPPPRRVELTVVKADEVPTGLKTLTPPPVYLSVSASEPEVNEEDVAKAKKLIAEIESTDYSEGHALRMTPLMQAHAAEVRLLMRKVPESHPTGWQLIQMISLLARKKQEAQIQPFIQGLARHHRPTDWYRLANDCRRQVARFDVDAETETTKKTNGTSRPPKKTEERPAGRAAMFSWPELPKLRNRLKRAPLVLAGGLAVEDKLSSMQTRFGVSAEWHEIQESSVRAVTSLVEKIRKGSVGAVICLEGLMAHSAWKDLQDTCKLSGVPFAMGDRAGIGALQQALDVLEKNA